MVIYIMIRYVICCMIFLLLLSSCSVEQPSSETETNLPQVNIENIVSVDELNKLYLENETIFNDMIDELKKLPTDVYFVSVENEKVSFFDNIGQEISPEFKFENAVVLRVFEVLNGFANKNHMEKYDIVICKADYGYSFVIRELTAYIDYSIVYCSTINSIVENFNNIKGSWYSYVFGLV